MTRPQEIQRWQDIEKAAHVYSNDDEKMGHEADLGRHFGFARLGIHHVRVPAGRRISFPHAQSTEDEFVHVIQGRPDVWLDGHLHRLFEGDSVGFVAGTGVAHTFINNTESEVRLLVAGDKNRDDNRVIYPMHLERKPMRDDWWDDAPARPLGPHDGMPDRR